MTPPSLPMRTLSGTLSALKTAADLAEERFGDRSVLDASQVSVIDLARTYCTDMGLSGFGTDPELTTKAVIVASCRTLQLRLLFEIQVDIERIMESQRIDYGEAVFSLAKGGGHKKVWAEIDALEVRAGMQLRGMREGQAPPDQPS